MKSICMWPRHVLAVSLALFLSLSVLAAGDAVAGLDRDLDPVNKLLGRDQLEPALAALEPIAKKHPEAPEIHVIRGEIFWRLGRLREAKAEYTKAQELDPKSADALAGLALVALSNENDAEAEKLARQALDLKDSHWIAHYVMGRVFLNRGDVQKAFEHFERGKKLKKRIEGRDLFESGMGLLALADHDPEGAETSLIKARALATNTVEHVMNLADLYERTEQWGNAINLFVALGDKLGTSPQLAYRLGRAYEHQQRWNDALKQYQMALEADSTYAPALAALGHLFLLDTRHTTRAAGILKRAIEIKPTPQAQLDYGIALTRLGQGDEAVEHIQAALAAAPSIEARVALARAYLASKTPEKGVEMFESDRDIRLEATADDLVQLGIHAIKQKDYSKARQVLEEALQKDPNNVDAVYRLGVVDLHQRNYEAAIDKIRKKLLKDPTYASGWMNLGVAYQGNKQIAEAAAAYKKAAELAPRSKQAWLALATAQSQLQRNAAAAAAYSKVLALDPKNLTALRGRGVAYLLLEQYPKAIRDLRAVTEARPDDAEAWVWLGQALLNDGKLDQAKPAFERAVQLQPENEAAQEGLQLVRGGSR